MPNRPINGDETMLHETKTNRFLVKSASGWEYVVVEYQAIIQAGHLQDPAAKIPGPKRFTLLDGSPVNYIDSEAFKIVATDEIVRKV